MVLGHDADAIRARVDFGAAEVVIAEDWADGQAASLRRGLAAAGEADAVVITLGDQPFITPQVIGAALDQLDGLRRGAGAVRRPAGAPGRARPRRCWTPRASCAAIRARASCSPTSASASGRPGISPAPSTSTPPRSCRRCEDRAHLRGQRRRRTRCSPRSTTWSWSCRACRARGSPGATTTAASTATCSVAFTRLRGTVAITRQRPRDAHDGADHGPSLARRSAVTARDGVADVHRRARTWRRSARSRCSAASSKTSPAACCGTSAPACRASSATSRPARTSPRAARRPKRRSATPPTPTRTRRPDERPDCGICAGDVPPLIGQVLTGTRPHARRRPRAGCANGEALPALTPIQLRLVEDYAERALRRATSRLPSGPPAPPARRSSCRAAAGPRAASRPSCRA